VTPQTARINEAAVAAFSRDVLNFPLFDRQAAIVSEIYSDGIREAILRTGRRSGKGRIAAVVATFEATVNADAHLAAVPPGERVSIVVVATSQQQARIVHRYVRKFLGAPALAPLVARDTDDEIELTNGIVIATVPAHAAAARGSASLSSSWTRPPGTRAATDRPWMRKRYTTPWRRRPRSSRNAAS